MSKALCVYVVSLVRRERFWNEGSLCVKEGMMEGLMISD